MITLDDVLQHINDPDTETRVRSESFRAGEKTTANVLTKYIRALEELKRFWDCNCDGFVNGDHDAILEYEKRVLDLGLEL